MKEREQLHEMQYHLLRWEALKENQSLLGAMLCLRRLRDIQREISSQ